MRRQAVFLLVVSSRRGGTEACTYVMLDEVRCWTMKDVMRTPFRAAAVGLPDDERLFPCAPCNQWGCCCDTEWGVSTVRWSWQGADAALRYPL
jgi:hypothetical protein